MQAVPSEGKQVPKGQLATRIGAVELANPLMNASGTWGSGVEATPLLADRLPGAVVTKSVTLEPRAGNPMPRLWETGGGLLNSIGLMNPGANFFLTKILPESLALGVPVVVNIGGESLTEYFALAQHFAGAGAIALEVNLSCPNVLAGKLPFASNPEVVEEVIAGVKERVDEPVWAKISPNVTDPALIARAAERGGADGLVCSNTLLGLAVDWRRGKTALPLGVAGYSGPPIKPVALRVVWQVAQAVSIPIIGVGGISSGEDVLEFLAAGASAVQVGTACLAQPDALARIHGELCALLAEEETSVAEVSRSLFKPGKGE